MSHGDGHAGKFPHKPGGRCTHDNDRLEFGYREAV